MRIIHFFIFAAVVLKAVTTLSGEVSTVISKISPAILMNSEQKSALEVLSNSIDAELLKYIQAAMVREKDTQKRKHYCSLGFDLIGEGERYSFVERDLTTFDGDPVLGMDIVTIYSNLFFRCVNDDALESVVPELITLVCNKSKMSCSIYSKTK